MSELIAGVRIKKLTAIMDERGKLMEILRADEEMFETFGQVYITTVHPGIIKAWHCHLLQTDHFTCVSGVVKMALADLRPDSSTRGLINEFFIGDDNPTLIKIPPGVYHGLKGVGATTAIALNVPTLPYNHRDPDEIRLPFDSPDIPYDWSVKLV